MKQLKNITVTCIMPTADRREFVAVAIDNFLNQDYVNKELIVIDDGTDKIRDLVPLLPQIKYIPLDKAHTVGAKRNLACDEASGDIIIHWDDDDWRALNWIRCQVSHLERTNADITGLDKPYFLNPAHNQAWQYIYPLDEKPWVHGATLCYTRAIWEKNPFPPINIGEDSAFLWSEQPKKIVPHQNVELFVGMIHEKNTGPKYTSDPRWHPIDTERIKEAMNKALPEKNCPGT